MAGCDAWPIARSIEFFKAAMDIASKHDAVCSFETHRGRSFYCPWNTAAVLEALPDIKLTCDFSHWVVVSERLMDSEWDAIELAARHAHHVHGRVGYDQGPQVPHPAAPEYAEALASLQRCWEAIWADQTRRGYVETTMTPESSGPMVICITCLSPMHRLPISGKSTAGSAPRSRCISTTGANAPADWSRTVLKDFTLRDPLAPNTLPLS